MAWPTDVKMQPAVYDQVFTTHWNDVRREVERIMAADNKRDYQLGDFAAAVRNLANVKKALGVTNADIDEWLQILRDHFSDKFEDRRFMERIFDLAVKANRHISMTVIDAPRWLPPTADHADPKKPINVTIRSRRVSRYRP